MDSACYVKNILGYQKLLVGEGQRICVAGPSPCILLAMRFEKEY